jgi:hypothetical protein
MKEVIEMMNIGTVIEVFPDLEEYFEAPLSFKASPKEVDEDTLEILKKFNSVKFTKDNFEALLSLSFEMVIQSKDGSWFPVRTGYFSIRFAGFVKYIGQDLQYKLSWAIKKIKFLDM